MLTNKRHKPRIKIATDEKFHVTNGDYIVFTVAFTAFTYSFFFYHTIQTFIGSIICVYEILQITVLPGKTRIRYIPKRFYLMFFILKIENKMREGIDDYRRWWNR